MFCQIPISAGSLAPVKHCRSGLFLKFNSILRSTELLVLCSNTPPPKAVTHQKPPFSGPRNSGPLNQREQHPLARSSSEFYVYGMSDTVTRHITHRGYTESHDG